MRISKLSFKTLLISSICDVWNFGESKSDLPMRNKKNPLINGACHFADKFEKNSFLRIRRNFFWHFVVWSQITYSDYETIDLRLKKMTSKMTANYLFALLEKLTNSLFIRFVEADCWHSWNFNSVIVSIRCK